MTRLIGFLKWAGDKLRRTGQEEEVVLLSGDVKTRCVGCLSEVGSLTFLASHLTDLRRRPLSESEVNLVSGAIADFCRVRRRRGECLRTTDTPNCLGVALTHIERLRRLDRCAPRERLAYWACLLVGDAERGETARRS